MGQGLTDAQLRELRDDPRFTPADMDLLSSAERTRLQQLDKEASTVGRVSDFATGVAKGAGQTAFNLGKMVNKTPILGDLTGALAKLVGPEGTDPDAAFAQDPEELKPTNTAQKFGKGAEQVGEFFIPGAAPRLAMTKGLAKLIPDAASPQMMKMLNRVASLAGRIGGDAASAGTIAAVHGDDNPEHAALAAGGGVAAGEALAPLVQLLRTPMGQRLFPLIAAGGTMSALGNITPGGLGLTMGAFGLAKEGARAIAKNPRTVPMVQRGVRAAGNLGGRAAAGAVDHVRMERRRLREGN